MVSVAGGIVIAIVVLMLAAALGWVVFTQLRARRLGLPPPSFGSYIPWKKSDDGYGSRSGGGGNGVVGWISDKFGKLKSRNNRSAAGAYEESGRRGFGPLDPDDAWDTRMGNDPADSYGYYEEREMGARPSAAGHGAQSTEYMGPVDISSRNLGANPYEGTGGGVGEQRGRPMTRDQNPFDDDAASSLRDVSPRPMGGGGPVTRDSFEGRRSAFREEV